MPELQLEPAEATLLRQILERFLGDLRMEIGKTERFELRQDLKHDEETVKAMLGRL